MSFGQTLALHCSFHNFNDFSILIHGLRQPGLWQAQSACCDQCQRLGGSRDKHFSWFWRMEVWGQDDSMVGCWLSPSSCFVDPQLFTMSACGRESELALVSSSPYKGTDPILGAPTSLTSPKPNYLPKPHLQLPSNWGLGIQHTDVEEEHKHSVHSIHLL